MTYKLFKIVLATCLAIGVSGVGHTSDIGGIQQKRPAFRLIFNQPTAPPGMVPMIVYVPAQQMQAPIPPHTHAPQAAQTIDATHCSINDVAVLTQNAPSCEKAGGRVVAERASFFMTLADPNTCMIAIPLGEDDIADLISTLHSFRNPFHCL